MASSRYHSHRSTGRRFFALFGSHRDALQFADIWCNADERTAQWEFAGRHIEAACLRKQEGQYALALNILQKETTHASRRLQEIYLLAALWHELPFGTCVPPGTPEPPALHELLLLAGKLQETLSPRAQKQVQFLLILLYAHSWPDCVQVAMFQILAGRREAGEALSLGVQFWNEHENRNSAVHCLDFFFSWIFGQRSPNTATTPEQAHERRYAFALLIMQLATFARRVHPMLDDGVLQRVFKLRLRADGSIESRSSWFNRFTISHADDYRFSEDNATACLRFESADLKNTLRDALRSHIASLMEREKRYRARSPAVCSCYVDSEDVGGVAEKTHTSEAASSLHKVFFPQIVMYDALYYVDKTLFPLSTQRYVRSKLQSRNHLNDGLCAGG